MSELWSDLLDCLDLRRSPLTDRPDPDEHATAVTVFEGSNQHLDYHRLFGGQILGQFVRSAELACPSKHIKSLHALFAREGRAEEPVRYEVTCLHEGRSFATLSVVARQSSRVVATASVSMHAAEDGPDHQTVAEVPPVLTPEYRVNMELIPWEIRSTTDLNSTAPAAPESDLWMRTPPVAPELAPALTAYATDLSLIGTALRPLEGLSQLGNGTAFTSAVTSHNLWFHRPFRTDNWLLLRQHSPLVAHGRCFGRGDVLTESGDLVASYAQEALLRLPS
ncbi:MAG: acyl-CoA thioesterase domain-containing protein [Rhodococcus sp. (in: high G+C Gram-positive bacteria)]|uniref:acyl-CoA thioesterase n=1 Tax=Rhodococcus sp. TaxID=1831 RepID=UPI003BB0C94B